MTASRAVVIGADTHLDTVHLAALSPTGSPLADAQFPTRPAGYYLAVKWAQSLGEVLCAGVEGTSSYGAGLTRALQDAGIEHRIALARMSRDERTRAYVQRQLANGRSKLDILRLLKRAIAREAFRLLTQPCAVDDYSDPRPARPARQAKNITLATVATHFGVWPNDISRLERGLKRNDTLAADYRHWLSAA